MRHWFNAIAWPVAVAVSAVMLWPQMASAQPVLFRVQTDTGNDTLRFGDTANIIFTIDPNGNQVAAFTFPLLIRFTNGNIIGIIRPGFELIFPPEFGPCPFCEPSENSKGTDPDTILWGWIGFPAYLDTAAEVARFRFQPLDTGQIVIDTTLLPPANHLLAVDPATNHLPLEWESPPLTVFTPTCSVALTGDNYQDGQIDVKDILYFIRYFWKSGPPPLPCPATGDVDCSGMLEVADVIYLINYVFKSGPEPCDVCWLVWDGTWTCD